MSKVHLVYTTGCFMEAALLPVWQTLPRPSPPSPSCSTLEVHGSIPWRLSRGSSARSTQLFTSYVPLLWKQLKGVSFLLCFPNCLGGSLVQTMFLQMQKQGKSSSRSMFDIFTDAFYPTWLPTAFYSAIPLGWCSQLWGRAG